MTWVAKKRPKIFFGYLADSLDMNFFMSSIAVQNPANVFFSDSNFSFKGGGCTQTHQNQIFAQDVDENVLTLQHKII